MISKHDIAKEKNRMIKELINLIKQSERDNLFLLIVLGATVVMMFLDAAWR